MQEKIKLPVRALGLLPFIPPVDWNFKSSIINETERTLTDGSKIIEVKYTHPSGDICTAIFATPENRTHCPYAEMEIVVRFGTDSKEHREYVRQMIKKGNEQNEQKN